MLSRCSELFIGVQMVRLSVVMRVADRPSGPRACLVVASGSQVGKGREPIFEPRNRSDPGPGRHAESIFAFLCDGPVLGASAPANPGLGRLH